MGKDPTTLSSRRRLPSHEEPVTVGRRCRALRRVACASYLGLGSRPRGWLCGEGVPGVGGEFAAVGSVDAQHLVFEGGGPVGMSVEESVVVGTEQTPVLDTRQPAVFPVGVMVDFAPSL